MLRGQVTTDRRAWMDLEALHLGGELGNVAKLEGGSGRRSLIGRIGNHLLRNHVPRLTSGWMNPVRPARRWTHGCRIGRSWRRPRRRVGGVLNARVAKGAHDCEIWKLISMRNIAALLLVIVYIDGTIISALSPSAVILMKLMVMVVIVMVIVVIVTFLVTTIGKLNQQGLKGSLAWLSI